MFKPMLATNITIRDLKLPVMVSNKLEGVRAEFTEDGLKTRPLKRFNNRWLEMHFLPIVDYCRINGIVMEGEVYLNRLGTIVDHCWTAIPIHFPNVRLDRSNIMPNHLHGIIIIDDKGRGTTCRAPLAARF